MDFSHEREDLLYFLWNDEFFIQRENDLFHIGRWIALLLGINVFIIWKLIFVSIFVSIDL